MRISDWSSDVCSSDLRFYRRRNIAEPRQIEQHRVRSSRRQRLEVGCSFAERAGDGVTARESRFRKRAAQPTRNARNQPSTAHSGHPSKTSPASFWNIVAASKIGRAHVCTPVTNAHFVCRLLLEKKNHQARPTHGNLSYKAKSQNT